MKLVLLVGIGSFVGGILRYLLSLTINERIVSNFPYGTLAVNLAGCFLIGCLFSIADRWQVNTEMRLLLITGLLGGFTTFSAFSAETVALMRTGHAAIAITYVAASVVLGIALTFMGALVCR